MWKKVAPLLIALSVALNLGVGGVWLAHAVNAYRTSRTIGEKTDGVWCPLHRSLGVTEEQWRRLEPDFLVFRQKSQALSRALNEKRGALIDLIASPQPDPEAIATKQDEILSYQGKM
ncbi:MAG: periplasmic heavy metal sensor, partial [Candidatus Sumerlaeota bacterium]